MSNRARVNIATVLYSNPTVSHYNIYYIIVAHAKSQTWPNCRKRSVSTYPQYNVRDLFCYYYFLLFRHLQVITHILRYVSFTDRKRARMVDTKWYYASLAPEFVLNELIVINCDVQEQYVPDFMTTVNHVLKNSKRMILNLKMSGFFTFFNAEFVDESIYKNVKELYLDDIEIMTDSFIRMIAVCCNLEVLNLKDILQWPIFVPAHFNFEPLRRLKTISFNLRYFPSELFHFLLSLASNLFTLDLNFPIQRFEPPGFKSITQKDIVLYLVETKSVRHLKINKSCHFLSKVPKNLQLKGFSVKFHVYSRALNHFTALLNEHTFLEQLEVHMLPCCLLFSISRLIYLKQLDLTYFPNPECPSVCFKECLQKFCDSLNDMTDLKQLSLLPAKQLTIAYYGVLPTIPQCTLDSLQSLDFYTNTNKEIIRLGKNLTKLRIRNGDLLTVSDFKLLFENHTNLKDLWIDNCCKLNDDVLLKSGIFNIKGNYRRHIYYCCCYYY